MKGEEIRLVDYMEGKNKRFVIPVYQRNYDWRTANCKQLYDDLVNGLYNADPIQHMFWPIFNDTMTNSQGHIKNDYGYDSI